MIAPLAALVKGWKTVAFNVLASVLPILTLTEVRDVLPAEYLPWYALAVALGNLALRHYTTTPAAYKAPK
jgi:hypothetical protein